MSGESPTPAALDGIRVVDFGQYIAGPLLGMLLADQGADVIRVDPPGGPRWTNEANAVLHRGRSATRIDLTTEAGCDAALGLITEADIVIENFRPGVMTRLGLDPGRLTESDPRLIVCSLPGFPSDDRRADLPGWEDVVAAASGIVKWSSGRPVYNALPIPSVFGALAGALAVVMALISRERDGHGQRIEVPLHDAVFEPNLPGILANGASDRASAQTWQMQQFWSLARAHAFRGQYRCADDRFVDMTVHSARDLAALIDVGGRQDWLTSALIDDRYQVVPGAEDELARATRELFLTRPAEWWEEHLSSRGIAAATCRDAAEWLEHPQARANGTVVDVADPVLGPMRQPGPLAHLSRSRPTIRPRALDIDDASGAWSQSPRRTRTPETAGQRRRALEGTTVLDASMLLAGPECGHLLASYGAEVFKINEPHGLHGGRGGFADRDRGKLSITLDLKTARGLEVFWKLVDCSDVVLQNCRPGVAERLGIGYDDVRARKPDIVYASDSAFGDAGEWRERGGYEYQGQAVAGISMRYGGDDGAVVQPLPVVDIGTGYANAFGIGLALFHRVRSGEGQRVTTSLAGTATTVSSVFAFTHATRVHDEPRGQALLGSGARNRAYEVADGWIHVAIPDDAAECELRTHLEVDTDLALDKALGDRLRSLTVEAAMSVVNRGRNAAHEIMPLVDVLRDDELRRRGLIRPTYIANVGTTATVGPIVRLSRTPLDVDRPVPAPGADADKVLDRVGMGHEYDELVAVGAVVPPSGGPWIF
jgi:crotonobetainyl-CoA:carnitine CoA-transferase CaiB-like acyl-CoA transferase